MINKIENMLSTLQDYKRDKNSLMSIYVEERLSKSYNQYSAELQQSISFLTRKHEKSLVKRLNKLDGTDTN